MSRISQRVEAAKREHDERVAEMEDYLDTINALPEDTDPEERERHIDAYKDLTDRAKASADRLEQEIAFDRARKASAVLYEVGEEPKTYRKGGPHSYFRDILTRAGVDHPSTLNNIGAADRLRRHGEELITDRQEVRDVTSGDPGTASFIPPLYLGTQWIDEEVPGRPLADAVASIPLSATGKRMDFPRVQVAPAAAVQATEAAAVNEVDFDGETYSVNKVTIAGQNDLSIQGYEFADPGMDIVIMRELVKSYNSVLDTQLLSGSGSSGQHQGLRNVSGINTVAFASGNGAALVGKIYDAQSQISTNAPGYEADSVVMHPRRASWIASHRDTSGTLFQQASYLTQVGSQDRAFAENVAGLRVIRDANIATNLGTNTNEDELYVIASQELMLAESPRRVRVLTEVLSGTLQVRLQVYAFSAFAGGRRPKVITRISGAGLVPPTFPSS